ncbi:hypothetical protein TIFTF001_028712 [Ficus carica]|uniref:Uncharacterized protein n=1 Tax=Ficus carica TaxID=3494 RepID=A0AA88DQY6_FICCA|nr:hypothetical protein TIFTF001_028712 [Ficus carica]
MPEITRSPLTPSPEEVGIIVNGGTNGIVHWRSRRFDEISPMTVVTYPPPNEDLVTSVISENSIVVATGGDVGRSKGVKLHAVGNMLSEVSEVVAGTLSLRRHISLVFLPTLKIGPDHPQ